MMMHRMMGRCCDTDGRPDFEKMTEFMELHDRGTKLEAAGWSLFFIWLGIAWLADVGWGVGLLGVAAITLGMQGIRKLYRIPVEGFWVLVGFGFAVAGLWQWLNMQLPLAPFVLIGIGVVLLFWRVLPKTAGGHGRKSKPGE